MAVRRSRAGVEVDRHRSPRSSASCSLGGGETRREPMALRVRAARSGQAATLAGRAGMSLATGRPRRVISTDSPFSTRSRIARISRCNSRTGTFFMSCIVHDNVSLVQRDRSLIAGCHTLRPRRGSQISQRTGRAPAVQLHLRHPPHAGALHAGERLGNARGAGEPAPRCPWCVRLCRSHFIVAVAAGGVKRQMAERLSLFPAPAWVPQRMLRGGPGGSRTLTSNFDRVVCSPLHHGPTAARDGRRAGARGHVREERADPPKLVEAGLAWSR